MAIIKKELERYLDIFQDSMKEEELDIDYVNFFQFFLFSHMNEVLDSEIMFFEVNRISKRARSFFSYFG